MDAYELLMLLPEEEMHDAETHRAVEAERKLRSRIRRRVQERLDGGVDEDAGRGGEPLRLPATAA